MSETQTPATLNPADKPLDKMTVKELRELASTQFPQIKGISSLNKGPLIEAIQEAMGGAAPAKAEAPKAAAPKKVAKKAEVPAAKAKPVRLPAFAASECAATSATGKAKAEIKFLRSLLADTPDNATRAAARKQMKRLKKRSRRMGAETPAAAASEE